MRLDRIGRRGERAPASQCNGDRRRAAGGMHVLGVVGVLLILAGCDSGSMNEARRSQSFDEAETPQLSAQQATRTARTFFAPTGTPGPEILLAPSVETLAITLGVNPDGSPSGSYLSVPLDAGTIYATALLGNVQAGQHVAATFTDAFGNVVGGTDTELTANADAQWLTAPFDLSAAGGPGEFAIYVFAGGHQIGSLAFSVTSAGSGAQLLPDPPANPQARASNAPQAGQPTAASTNDNQNGSIQPEAGGAENQGGASQPSTDPGGQQSDGSGQQPGTTWQQQPDGTWQEQPPSQ